MFALIKSIKCILSNTIPAFAFIGNIDRHWGLVGDGQTAVGGQRYASMFHIQALHK